MIHASSSPALQSVSASKGQTFLGIMWMFTSFFELIPSEFGIILKA